VACHQGVVADDSGSVQRHPRDALVRESWVVRSVLEPLADLGDVAVEGVDIVAVAEFLDAQQWHPPSLADATVTVTGWAGRAVGDA
jgi:hypothetical protein